MRLKKNRSDAELSNGEATKRHRVDRGLGPFTGTQLTLLIGMFAAVVGFPMIASAVIPNGNTYNACANKKTGALRVIDTSKHQKCATTENAVSWSKTGSPGAKGAQGAQGVQGVQGVHGTNGTNGPPGPSQGALIYQTYIFFNGPHTNDEVVGNVTVPAGLMCVTAAGTAFRGTAGLLLVRFQDNANPFGPRTVDLEAYTNAPDSHTTLASAGTNCRTTAGGTFTYNGRASSPVVSDGSDFGSLSVQVFSQ